MNKSFVTAISSKVNDVRRNCCQTHYLINDQRVRDLRHRKFDGRGGNPRHSLRKLGPWWMYGYPKHAGVFVVPK